MLLPAALLMRAMDGVQEWIGWVFLLAIVDFVVPFLLITYGEQEISSSPGRGIQQLRAGR